MDGFYMFLNQFAGFWFINIIGETLPKFRQSFEPISLEIHWKWYNSVRFSLTSNADMTTFHHTFFLENNGFMKGVVVKVVTDHRSLVERIWLIFFFVLVIFQALEYFFPQFLQSTLKKTTYLLQSLSHSYKFALGHVVISNFKVKIITVFVLPVQ